VVKVRDRIKVCRDDRCIEVIALFDTGSGKSYINERAARELGYEKYPEPRKVHLAVKGAVAEIVGYVTAYLEIAGHRLPEVETLGVIKDLAIKAIVGLNIIEPYGIILEKERIRFRQTPPTTYLI